MERIILLILLVLPLSSALFKFKGALNKEQDMKVEPNDFDLPEESIDQKELDLDGLIVDEKEESKKSMFFFDLGNLLGTDLIEIWNKIIGKISGRSLSVPTNAFCNTFCLDFYNWCKEQVCLVLIQDESTKSIEVLPCYTTCAVHTAACCFL